MVDYFQVDAFVVTFSYDPLTNGDLKANAKMLDMVYLEQEHEINHKMVVQG